jgi:hypothetical protein
VTITSLFSSAQPFIPQRIVKQKETQLSERPFQEISKERICSECKYFLKDGKKCKLFYNIDLVEGKEYDKASEVRKSNNKCGRDGKYYAKNKIGDVIYENYPWILTGSYVILYLFILNYKYK